MYKLHHAKLEDDYTQKDIDVIEFNPAYKIDEYLKALPSDRVYLFTYKAEKDNAEIWITELSELLECYRNVAIVLEINIEDWFLQEYESYESAYDVALAMKEVSPLCYSSETINRSNHNPNSLRSNSLGE